MPPGQANMAAAGAGLLRQDAGYPAGVALWTGRSLHFSCAEIGAGGWTSAVWARKYFASAELLPRIPESRAPYANLLPGNIDAEGDPASFADIGGTEPFFAPKYGETTYLFTLS